jgi:hypothetical protein
MSNYWKENPTKLAQLVERYLKKVGNAKKVIVKGEGNG